MYKGSSRTAHTESRHDYHCLAPVAGYSYAGNTMYGHEAATFSTFAQSMHTCEARHGHGHAHSAVCCRVLPQRCRAHALRLVA